jgi:hypothetical protein
MQTVYHGGEKGELKEANARQRAHLRARALAGGWTDAELDELEARKAAKMQAIMEVVRREMGIGI